MKAKVINPFFFTGRKREVGEIIEVSEERIQSFLACNLVEKIEEEKEKNMQNSVMDKMIKEPEMNKMVKKPEKAKSKKKKRKGGKK